MFALCISGVQRRSPSLFHDNISVYLHQLMQELSLETYGVPHPLIASSEYISIEGGLDNSYTCIYWIPANQWDIKGDHLCGFVNKAVPIKNLKGKLG